MIAMGYGRISSSRHDGVSLEIQRDRYEKYCASHGYTPGGWFQDAGVSGSKVKRAGLDALLAACKAAGGVTIVTREISRIGRTTKLLERIKDAMANGSVIAIECWDGPSITNDANGRFTLNIFTSIAEKELEDTSSRIRARQAHDRAQGKPHTGGSRPFGSKADKRTPVPAEVAMIEKAADHILAGGSMSSIVRDWRASGVKTTTGGDWTYQSVFKVMTAERLDHLIGAERGGMVRLTMESRRKEHGQRSNVFVRWLNGILRCGVCGMLLDSHFTNHKPAYVCTRLGGCMRVSVTAANVENLIAGFVRYGYEGGGMKPDERYGALLAEQKENRAQLDRLNDLYVEGTLTKSDHAKRKDKLDTLGEKIDADLLTLSASAAMHGSIEVWDTLDASAKRSVVRERIGEITVMPSSGAYNEKGHKVFDTGRFRFQDPQALWFKGYVKSLQQGKSNKVISS